MNNYHTHHYLCGHATGNVNDYVLEFIGSRKNILASDLELDSTHEFIMLVCIIMYSKLPEVSYQIELLNNKTSKNGIRFNDFIIKLKGE